MAGVGLLYLGVSAFDESDMLFRSLVPPHIGGEERLELQVASVEPQDAEQPRQAGEVAVTVFANQTVLRFAHNFLASRSGSSF